MANKASSIQTRSQDFTQDFVKALTDPRVTDALVQALKPALTLAIEDIVKTKLKDIEEENSTLSAKLKTCEDELSRQK